MFDPYSFCLVVAGLILHLVWGSEDFNTSWVFGFLAALGLELAWEIIGNTPLVLQRIRSNNGTCGEYAGNNPNSGLARLSVNTTVKVTPYRTSLVTSSPALSATFWAQPSLL